MKSLAQSRWSDAEQQLAQIKDAGLLRSLRSADGAPGATFSFEGRQYVNFSSNNYLDLAAHPLVKAAAVAALEQYGAGASGSRLISGSMKVHDELEEALAHFKGTEASLVFSSGYMANLGVLQALSRRADGTSVPVYFDRLCHASIIDAVRLADSNWRTFRHNDVESLKWHLEKLPPAPFPRAVVITEGVFSMDGDFAPLAELHELCASHDAALVVDDAHGSGTVGPGGRGSIAAAGLTDADNIIQMGTLSKALGSMGGYIAGPRVVIDLLINRARTFIFDTALAPACAAAAMKSLEIIVNEPGRVDALQRNVGQLREALSLPPSMSPIISIIVGSAESAMDVSTNLLAADQLVVAIRPPTVPAGSSRLRVTPMSAHTQAQMTKLAELLGRFCKFPTSLST